MVKMEVLDNPFIHAGCTVYPKSRRVLLPTGEKVQMSPAVLDLFLAMVPGEVYTPRDLQKKYLQLRTITEVWNNAERGNSGLLPTNDGVVSENSVHINIYRLRALIGEDLLPRSNRKGIRLRDGSR